MTLDPETILRSLHDQFCQLTGKQHRYEQWRHDWYEFNRFYTRDDLSLVIAYANRVNQKREKRYQIVLSLRKLISDLRAFDDLLGEARVDAKARAAKARAWQPSEADKILGEFKKTEPTAPDEPPKRVSLDFIADALKKAKQ